MKKPGSGFFAIDRRIWAEVCNLGMNEAVAYLLLAQGTGRDNRSTSWSATALHKYASISYERGVAAIEHLIRQAFVLHAEKHTKAKPRYQLTTWAEFMGLRFTARLSWLSPAEKVYLESLSDKGTFWEPYGRRKKKSFDSLVEHGFVWETCHGDYTRDLSPESDPIWLPNTLVTGTTKGEESPIKRLRKSRDVWALRLLVDLYQSQNLRDDGGISPRVLAWGFDRKLVGRHGIHVIYAFKPGTLSVGRHEDVMSIHFGKDRKRPDGTEPFWGNLELLRTLGLIHFIPHLWESNRYDSEIIYPYGIGWPEEEEIEFKIGEAARRAAMTMAFEDKIEQAASEGFHWLAPVPSTIPNPAVIGVARLRYRPHTKRTSAWYGHLHENGLEYIRGFNKISGINELENAGCINGNQRTSRAVKGG